ncbi:MAG: hypothetical protein IAG13_28185 [Deltaproteobacteria bacterium]|nr:hypothetical protein [Nannocystaceae bacterium]
MTENTTLLAQMALIAGIAGEVPNLPDSDNVLRVLDTVEERAAASGPGDVPDGAWRVATRAGELRIIHVIGNIED